MAPATKQVVPDEYNPPVRWTFIVLLMSGWGLAHPTGSHAQRPDVRSEVGLWASHSVAAGTVLGKIPHGRLRMLGLRYQYRLMPTPAQSQDGYEGATLTFTADFVGAGLHLPRRATPGSYFTNGPSTGTALTTTGLGLYPMGLRLLSDGGTVRPFLAGHTGLMYFSAAVPDPRGRQLNFAAALGGGLSVSLSGRIALTIGYRYHHLSNGFRGSINPGFDANVLYFGLDRGL
jgi:hypothetical protein